MPILFVKSQRLTLRSGRVRSDPSLRLGPEEASARDNLRKEGIKFETIDLSKAIRDRVQARFKGITVTPTLIDEHSPEKLYVGAKAILDYIEDTRATARSRSPAHWTTRSRWV